MMKFTTDGRKLFSSSEVLGNNSTESGGQSHHESITAVPVTKPATTAAVKTVTTATRSYKTGGKAAKTEEPKKLKFVDCSPFGDTPSVPVVNRLTHTTANSTGNGDLPTGFVRFKPNESCPFANCKFFGSGVAHIHCVAVDCNFGFVDKNQCEKHSELHERSKTLGAKSNECLSTVCDNQVLVS